MIKTDPVSFFQPNAAGAKISQPMNPRFGAAMNIDAVSPSLSASDTVRLPEALIGYVGAYEQRDASGAITGYARFLPNVTGGLNVTFFGPGGKSDDPHTVSFNFPDQHVETLVRYKFGLVVDMHKDIVLDDEGMQLYRAPHVAEVPESGNLEEADYKLFAEAQYRLERNQSGAVTGFTRSSINYYRFVQNGDRLGTELVSSRAHRPPLVDKFYKKIEAIPGTS